MFTVEIYTHARIRILAIIPSIRIKSINHASKQFILNKSFGNITKAFQRRRSFAFGHLKVFFF